MNEYKHLAVAQKLFSIWSIFLIFLLPFFLMDFKHSQEGGILSNCPSTILVLFFFHSSYLLFSDCFQYISKRFHTTIPFQPPTYLFFSLYLLFSNCQSLGVKQTLFSKLTTNSFCNDVKGKIHHLPICHRLLPLISPALPSPFFCSSLSPLCQPGALLKKGKEGRRMWGCNKMSWVNDF